MIVSLAALAATVASAPLAPSSKWTLDYEKSACVLARRFGDGPDAPVLMFKPWPLSSSVELVIDQLTASYRATPRGTASVATPDGKVEMRPYQSWVPDRETHHRTTVIYLDRTILGEVGDGGTVAIGAGTDAQVSVAVNGFKAALAALGSCNDDLAVSLGVPPEELSAIAHSAAPIGELGAWFGADDYPGEALARGEQGAVTVLWTIGLDGHASDCRVITSSGWPLLDKTTCATILRRARYRPAVDRGGKPMASHSSGTFRWLIPSG